MRKYPAESAYQLCFALAVVSLLLLTPEHSSASVFRSNDDVHISHLHRIEDDFYCVGQKVRVDGTIEGDLISLGHDCTIQGTVAKSVNLAVRFAKHSGRIGGSLRAIAEQITISGQVDGSVLAAGYKVRVTQGSLVKRDVNLYGADVSLDGAVNGNACVAGAIIHITGSIQGDVELEGEQITISRPAVISGDLSYISGKEARIDTVGVSIVGRTTWNLPETKEDIEEEADYLTDITLQISSLLAAFLFGIIVVRLFRPYAEESFRQLKSKFSVSLAAGFVSVLLLIACIIILVISLFSTLIGRILISGDQAILGTLLLAVSILLVPITSFVSVSGGIVLYSGMVIMAFLVGFAFIRLVRPEPAVLSASSLFLGLVILTILCALPYVGLPVYILATIVGAGSIILGVKNCRRKAAGGRDRPSAEPAETQ